MKKLKLNLDELRVESFHTTPEDGEGREGTVYGFYKPDTQSMCMVYTDCPDCTITCGVTCGVSCNGTCVGPTCDGSNSCVPQCAPW